jgi:hypothetical protein
MEAWGQQHGALPLLLEKPGRTRQEPPRRWHGQSVVRRVPVEYADGRLDVAEVSFLVVHSSQLAHQAEVAYAAAQAKEAERVTNHIQHVEAQWFACAADAEAAIAEYEGRGQGRRGRKPRPWRYHGLHYRVEAVRVPKKRTQRGRPPKAEAPQVEVRYRLIVHPEALVPSEDAHGWAVLATTLRPEECTNAEMLEAYQEQHMYLSICFFRTIRLKARIIFTRHDVIMLWWVLDMTYRQTEELGWNDHGVSLARWDSLQTDYSGCRGLLVSCL